MKEIGYYCGELIGKTFDVPGNYVVLTFHSDYADQYRGYWIFFTAVPFGKYNKSAIGYFIVFQQTNAERMYIYFPGWRIILRELSKVEAIANKSIVLIDIVFSKV